jgi:hypothetical protein
LGVSRPRPRGSAAAEPRALLDDRALDDERDLTVGLADRRLAPDLDAVVEDRALDVRADAHDAAGQHHLLRVGRHRQPE